MAEERRRGPNPVGIYDRPWLADHRTQVVAAVVLLGLLSAGVLVALLVLA